MGLYLFFFLYIQKPVPESVYHHIMNQSYHDKEAQWCQFSLKCHRKPFLFQFCQHCVRSPLCTLFLTDWWQHVFIISLVQMQFYHLPSAICCLAALFSLKGWASFSSWCCRSDRASHLEHLHTKHTFGTDLHHVCLSHQIQLSYPLALHLSLDADSTFLCWQDCLGGGCLLMKVLEDVDLIWALLCERERKHRGSGVSVVSFCSRRRTKCSCSVDMVNTWDAVWHLKS